MKKKLIAVALMVVVTVCTLSPSASADYVPSGSLSDWTVHNANDLASLVDVLADVTSNTDSICFGRLATHPEYIVTPASSLPIDFSSHSYSRGNTNPDGDTICDYCTHVEPKLEIDEETGEEITPDAWLTYSHYDDGLFYFLIHGYDNLIGDKTSASSSVIINDYTNSDYIRYSIEKTSSSTTNIALGQPSYWITDVTVPMSGNWAFSAKTLLYGYSGTGSGLVTLAVADRFNSYKTALDPVNGINQYNVDPARTVYCLNGTLFSSLPVYPTSLNGARISSTTSGLVSIAVQWYVTCDSPYSDMFEAAHPQPIEINGKLVVVGDDNNITYYDNVDFINQTNKTVYSPQTNVYHGYDYYTYDFGDGTYNFYDVDGTLLLELLYQNDSVIQVVHDTDDGENVTNVYNYYYYVNETNPGTDPTDPGTDPTDPGTDPTDPGTDPTDPGTDPGGDEETIGWLEKIYNAIIDGTETLKKAINAISFTYVGDIQLSGDEDEDNQSWFDAFMQKFNFVWQIADIGESFITDICADQGIMSRASTGFSGGASTPPNITINLGSARSVYGVVYGGEVAFIDFSWYAEYKPSVDTLLSGFLWLLFLWGIFKQAPSIISGGATVTNKMDDIYNGQRSFRK